MKQSSQGHVSRRTFIGGLAALGFSAAFSRSVRAGTTADAVVVHGLDLASSGAADRFRRALAAAAKQLTGVQSAAAALGMLLPLDLSYSVRLDATTPLAATRSALVNGCLQELLDRGVQPWDIAVWDRRAAEIKHIRYAIPVAGNELEIQATEQTNDDTGHYEDVGLSLPLYTPMESAEEVRAEKTATDTAQSTDAADEQHMKTDSMAAGVSRFMARSRNALINLPTLRHHPATGITGALAGPLLSGVQQSHRFIRNIESVAGSVSELWSASVMKSHVLTVLDATRVLTNNGPVGMAGDVAEENALVFGFDPVAVDIAALQIIDRYRGERSLPLMTELAAPIIARAAEQGIGTKTPRIIRLSQSQVLG